MSFVLQRPQEPLSSELVARGLGAAWQSVKGRSGATSLPPSLATYQVRAERQRSTGAPNALQPDTPDTHQKQSAMHQRPDAGQPGRLVAFRGAAAGVQRLRCRQFARLQPVTRLQPVPNCTFRWR